MAAIISISDFVGFPLKCFKAYGLLYSDKEPASRRRKVLLNILRFASFFSITIPSVLLIVFIKENSNNLPLIVENMTPNGYALIVAVKLICIHRKKERFLDLLEALDDLMPKTKGEQNIFKVRK
jgi:hypothetical protein